MKKTLWCGGSHLASCKEVILSMFQKAENAFYITAGPKIKRWSINGGTYRVSGSLIGGNGYEPKRVIDLSYYDRIIFVGQYIQPQRYFHGFHSDYDQKLSTSAISVILEADNFLIRLPGGIYNQPLELFPSLHTKVVLLSDPWIAEHQMNQKCLHAFRAAVKNFCVQRNIEILFQPERTQSEPYKTSTKYKVKKSDNGHFNKNFWNEYLSLVEQNSLEQEYN